MAALASLAASALWMAALAAAGKDERRALLYAWSPLVALEFANSAHLDVYALLFMSAALLLALKRRPVGAAACLALGGLVKFFPLLLMPVWGRRWGKAAWLVCGLVFALPWLPLRAGGAPLTAGTPFKGLGIFAARGDFNNSIYRMVEDLWFLIINHAGARLWARATVFACLAVCFLIYLLRRRGETGVLPGWRFAGTFLGLSLALSPVVHPWYLCWMLAFIAIEGRLVWLIPSVTVIFARHIYIGYEQTGLWQESWWPSLAVWVPFYLGLAISIRPDKMVSSLIGRFRATFPYHTGNLVIRSGLLPSNREILRSAQDDKLRSG
jgi:hypothetical protein